MNITEISITACSNPNNIVVAMSKELLSELFTGYFSLNDIQLLCLEYQDSDSYHLALLPFAIQSGREMLVDMHDLMDWYGEKSEFYKNYPSISFNPELCEFLLCLRPTDDPHQTWRQLLPQLAAVFRSQLGRSFTVQTDKYQWRRQDSWFMDPHCYIWSII